MLVMTSFSLAPVASATETETTTSPPTTTTTTPPPELTTTTPPAVTTTPPAVTTTTPPAVTTTKAPAVTTAPTTTTPEESESEEPTSEKPTVTTTAPTTTTPAVEKRQVARGLNPGIVVEITDIQVEGGTNDEQITVGDAVTVSGTWDASAADPKAGDEFTVKFPDELKLDANPNLQLKGEDGTVWGNCVLDGSTNLMNCVLTDAVTANPELVHGTFTVFTKAVEYTTSEEVEFEINGEGTLVDLPGEGGISDGKDLGDATKSGKLQPDKQAVRWTIDIPGSDLIALDAGNTGSVQLSDELSANMKLCDDGRLNAKLFSGRPGALTEVPGGVTITQNAAGDPVIIDINTGAPFEKDQLYRIEYASCTTSGTVDPKDTQYDNSITIGDETVGAGVGQDWEPTTVPSKSGKLLNSNGERYRVAEWTVMVPGTFIESSPGKKVTIADTLTGGHAVCDTGLALKIEKANYLPGPGGGGVGRTDVTDQFAITEAATPGAEDFTVSFTPNDPFDVEQYYYVTYRSCLTGDEVPDNSDVFTNTALVNGSEVTASVKGPEFKGNKKGGLNTEPTEVGGEMQPAGTTVDWDAEVPGRNLEALTERAVITDTFSDTLTVCDVSGDLKEDLNFRVVAKDAIGGSGAAPDRDLTADTIVTRTANGIEITLPKDDAAGDYSRETKYVIEYTLCTASGGLDDRGTVYGNSLAYEGAELTSSVTQTWGGSGTGEGVSRGSFSLLKQIDSASEKFPEGTEFTVKVEEFAPGVDPAVGPASSTYEIKVKADGTPVSGLNPRGTGWTIRLSEVNLPQVDGVYFEQGKFRPADGVTLSDGDTVALVEIEPKTNVEVSLVNKAVLGATTITKTVLNPENTAITGDESFVIKAEIAYGDGGSELREFTLKGGQSYELKDLPIGAKVTFTEVKPVNTDLVTWSEPVITPQTITIGTDAAANTIAVTNEAKITQGTFELSKKLTGPEASNGAVPETFDVIATWTDAAGVEQSKTLTLPSDGTPVPFGENLPGGTKVTLTEVVPDDGNGLAWGVPAFTGDVTIDGDSGVVTIGKDPGTVEVTNFVDKNDGTLRILKQVAGEAAESVGDDAEFKVEARWKDGTEYRTTVLTVKNGVATPLGVDLPIGTEVTFTEIGRPDIEGVEWGTITWGTDPSGESWIVSHADGTATGIVSDDPTEGRLITLTNEALWEFGSVEFTKYILDGDERIPATDADLPDGAEFEVRIDNIDPPLPADVEFPAVGETITLNAENGFSWTSGDVLPRGTVVTFSEVDPKDLPGFDWARPYYWVAEDAGDADYRNTVGIVPGEQAVVEIHNRIIPTTDLDIEKIVTGPKGNQVMKDPAATFQVTATWTDADGEARSCILDVKPGGSVTPTAQCDAAVVDGKVQFPLDTEVNFVETGAHTDVPNVKWGEVVWDVKEGDAEATALDGESTGTTVTLTGDANGSVVLGLENKTSSNGLIIIPIPIPLPPWGGIVIPPWGGGSSVPPWGGGSSVPPGPGTGTPPGPSVPGGPGSPGNPGGSGHNGAPGKPAPSKPGQSSSLPVTGANVIWLTGGALALIAGGAWLALRNRRKMTGEE
ncbi:DUF5979 domain-containing protein [Rhodococcus sp. NPDC058532]|uniref:DUF5979 domain-containing protein n=1 Tax=Rhodococcus sp. NPDC058532 TaxID=3346540 RepID=UPI0036646F26